MSKKKEKIDIKKFKFVGDMHIGKILLDIDKPPRNPKAGDLYFDTKNSLIYVYDSVTVSCPWYDNGNGEFIEEGQWIALSGNPDG